MDIFLGLHLFCDRDGVQGLGCIIQGWCLGSSSFEEEQGPPPVSSTLVSHAQDSQLSCSLGLAGEMCSQQGMGSQGWRSSGQCGQVPCEALGWPLLLQGMLCTALVTWGWTQLLL